ncbi:MAG: hypothetical protein OXC92_10935 [Flavobacteriaceae bacterium]|nr:hypothetical protein [Flavobacteriaceae bacterium]MCY4217477.1 hypothetical protein [Flavobacteriaceae bacterium]MCY4253179.1 hypothetical protein [Flavobacteriaceae bacterium]
MAELEVWPASQEGIDVQIVYLGVVLSTSFLNRSSGKLIPQIKNQPFLYKRKYFIDWNR